MRARNAGSDCSWLAARPQGIERDNALIVGGFYGATDAQAFADLCYMRWGLPRVAPSDPRTAVFRLENRKFSRDSSPVNRRRFVAISPSRLSLGSVRL